MDWKASARLLLLVSTLTALTGNLFPHLEGKAIRVNLGTIAPRGSVVHQALQEMGEKWRQIPGGGVRLVVYPDGTQGGEGDMVKLMRVGMLQAGLFTAVGLAEFEPGVIALQNMPMMFHSLNEFDYVKSIMKPELENLIENKGFMVLFWMDTGWLRFFSRKEFLLPEDLKKMRMWVSAGDIKQAKILLDFGYWPVELETGEIIEGMQTGLIDVAAVPPIFALAGQLDHSASFMLELNWAPLIGAAVINQKTWEEIPLWERESLLFAAREAGKAMNRRTRKESVDAVAAMRKRGLRVIKVSDKVEREWEEAARKIYPAIRGGMVPSPFFDKVLTLLKNYRQGRG